MRKGLSYSSFEFERVNNKGTCQAALMHRLVCTLGVCKVKDYVCFHATLPYLYSQCKPESILCTNYVSLMCSICEFIGLPVLSIIYIEYQEAKSSYGTESIYDEYQYQ